MSHVWFKYWYHVFVARQWFYQTCSEFGFYQTSDSDNQPFGKMFPLNFSVQQCEDVFGPAFTQSFISSRIAWTIANYGSRNISGDTQNIVFPNGSIDPWHALGILDSVNMYTTAVFITGTAHCANMYPPRPEDLQTLVDARQVISQRIGQFLMRGWECVSHGDIYICYVYSMLNKCI